MIIPSIDLMNGKAVQLRQGKEKVLEKENVLDLAKEFSKYGEIAVIDLDSVLGKGNNIELIKKICKIAECRVGGGIRTIKKANKLLKAGAKKIITGTKASKGFLKQLPKKRIIVAIDSKDSYVVDRGWTNNTKKTPQEVISELEEYCSEFLFTNVDIEGTMKGCNFNLIKKLKSKNKITIAGGISSIKEIRQLEDLGFNSQLGMALYTKKIDLIDSFVSLLDFDKNKGLIPTIVQDDKKQVLMLAYSSKESLTKTFKTGKAVYYSRSREKIWTKGETSGNFQELINVKYDCDNDTLLFTIKQKNFACHLGTYSCFGDKKFNLEEIYNVILCRLNNPKKDSYTSKLLKDENIIKAKIKEESEELINYKNRDNLVWEIADLTYFIMALMVKKNIRLDDIKNELWVRRK